MCLCLCLWAKFVLVTTAVSMLEECSFSTAILFKQNLLNLRRKLMMTYRTILATDESSQKIHILAMRQMSDWAEDRPDTLLLPIPEPFGHFVRSLVLRFAFPVSRSYTSVEPLAAYSQHPWTAFRLLKLRSSCGLSQMSWTDRITSKILPNFTSLILLKVNWI